MALTSCDNLPIIGVHGAARDSLRANGVENKVGWFDRTAALDAVLRALPCVEGSASPTKMVSKFFPED